MRGHVFLDIEHPVVAWATYRGTIISVDQTGVDGPSEGWLSMFAARLLDTQDVERLLREALFDDVRRREFPRHISRFHSLYFFPSVKGATAAAEQWGGRGDTHFSMERLAEVGVDAASPPLRLDSNWITHWRTSLLKDAPSAIEWARCYWSGQPFPNCEPIWENLCDGRMHIVGTALRDQAYENLKSHFPKSLARLEIARIGASLGSDLGSVAVLVRKLDDRTLLARWLMDMRDAKNPDFLACLDQHIKAGHEVNWSVMKPYHESGELGRMPDLTPWTFRIPCVAAVPRADQAADRLKARASRCRAGRTRPASRSHPPPHRPRPAPRPAWRRWR